MQEDIDHLFKEFGQNEVIVVEQVENASRKVSVSATIPSVAIFAGIDMTAKMRRVLLSELCSSIEQIILEELERVNPSIKYSWRKFKVDSVLSDYGRSYDDICKERFEQMANDHRYCVCTSPFPTRLLPYSLKRKAHSNNDFRRLHYTATLGKVSLYSLNPQFRRIKDGEHIQFVFSNGPVVKLSVSDLTFVTTQQRITLHLRYNVALLPGLQAVQLQNIL